MLWWKDLCFGRTHMNQLPARLINTTAALTVPVFGMSKITLVLSIQRNERSIIQRDHQQFFADILKSRLDLAQF